MAPGGELTYALACSMIIGVVWLARKDIITRGVLVLFAGVLLYSAYGLLTGEDEGEEDLSQNRIVKFTKEFLPSTEE